MNSLNFYKCFDPANRLQTRYRTAQADIYWIGKFLMFHNLRHPREIGAMEIREFLSHLAVRKNVAASTQQQALNAIMFKYKQVFKCGIGDIGLFIRSGKPEKAPTVFGREKAKKAISHLKERDWLLIKISVILRHGRRLTHVGAGNCIQEKNTAAN